MEPNLERWGSPYAALGIEEGSGPDVIRQAYRKLSLKFHPDKCDESRKQECTEMFKKISWANTFLADEDKMAYYNQYHRRAQQAPSPSSSPANLRVPPRRTNRNFGRPSPTMASGPSPQPSPPPSPSPSPPPSPPPSPQPPVSGIPERFAWQNFVYPTAARVSKPPPFPFSRGGYRRSRSQRKMRRHTRKGRGGRK